MLFAHLTMTDVCGSPKTFCAKEAFLASALFDGLEDCNISHLKTILEKTDANPNVILPKQGISPLHLAVGNESEDFALKVTRLFLQYGGNPNVRSVERQTPVHIAAAWGRVHIFRLLLLNGGDPWIHDCDGNNAFHYAYKEHHWDIVKILQRFWHTDSCKEGDTIEEKYALTFEKAFVYGSSVAYEYRMDPQSAACPLQTVSVSTQTCTSSGDFSELAKDGHNHQESCGQCISQTSVIKDKSDSCYDVSTQACQKCSLSDIAVNGCAENRSCRTIVNQKSVTDDVAAQNQMHLVTHESVGDTLKKKRDWVNSYNSFDTDFKAKLPNNSSCPAEQILCNSEYSTSAAECVQKCVSGHPSLERIVDGSLNISNKNRHLPLKCQEEFKVENRDGFRVVVDTAEDDVLPAKTNIKDDWKFNIIKCTTDITPLASELPAIESGVERFDNNCKICRCCGSAYCKGSRTCEPESTSEVKCDVTMAYSGTESRCEFDRLSTYGVLSPDLISDEDWIASQSCFLLSESTDYVTCDETYPAVRMTDVGVSSVFQEEGQEANCLENNTSNPSGETHPSTSSVPASDSVDSFVSLSEEYKYSDKERGVVLLERRFLVPAVGISELQTEEAEIKLSNPPQPSSRLQDVICSSGDLTDSDVSVPSSLDYDTDVLRGKLKENGYIPGPIVATTKRLYLRKLLRIQRKPVRPPTETKVYSPELQRTIHHFNWKKWFPDGQKLENEAMQQFLQPEPLWRWRGGILKSSFTYLLLDPRVTNNLPCRVGSLSEPNTWSTFLSSIFYIGKGKRSRPYSHLYQAFAVWKKKTVVKTDKKVQFILDIWKAGMGVVCLHVFQNVIPAEAYTREASMIDAIDLRNLENARRGDYYGVAATWTSHHKRMLGTYLLYRAMCIFIHEGERQLRPGDIG